MKNMSSNLRGVAYISLAMFIFSLQSVAVKWIGGDYSIMEIVLFRSIVALPCTLVLYRIEGGRGWPSTQQPLLEYVRGVLYFISYTTAFMALAALPLAELEAIRSSAPLVITLLSVLMLGEKVGPRRWMALAVGFLGVLLIVRPGSASFNLGSVFMLLAVLSYALSAILTRKLQTTDSSATMSYYSSIVYMIAAVLLSPLAVFVGEVPNAHPSIAFLLRAWTMPTPLDLAVMSGLGLVWVGGMYFIARAYSSSHASVIAPFEYISLPINVMWGLLIWHEVPTWLTWAGALLTIGSGLFVLYRDRAHPLEVHENVILSESES